MNPKKENIVRENSFAFAVRIVNCCKHVNLEHKEFTVARQLLRSGTSIGANVREAVNAESTADFIHKLSIAQKECDETIFWIELLCETDYLTEKESISLKSEAESLLKIIRSIILTTKAHCDQERGR